MKKIIGVLQDRYTELSRLSGQDNSKSVEWYDGAMDELKRTIERMRTITPQPANAPRQKYVSVFENGEELTEALPKMDVGEVVLYHGHPHKVVDTDEQGKRVAAFRPPFSEEDDWI